MRIALLESFYTGSHRRWAEELARHSSHEIRIVSLPGAHWKWRMHGGAVSLFTGFQAFARQTDMVLTTDMVDVGVLRGLLHREGISLPVAVYFHENQLVYPWSPGDPDPGLRRDRHYAFINFTSALAADAVLFNSSYHRDSFLAALDPFLRDFPDQPLTSAIADIEQKSHIRYPGLELPSLPVGEPHSGPIRILWNHRWEYDKGPDDFFRLLFDLQDEGVPFELIVLGESFRDSPPVFREALERLSGRLLHAGYCRDRKEYLHWLGQADLLPVTSVQDFFGYSVVEAMAAGVQPLLPCRLAYPEHSTEPHHFYSDLGDLRQRLRTVLSGGQRDQPKEVRRLAERYDWMRLIGGYDDLFLSLRP